VTRLHESGCPVLGEGYVESIVIVNPLERHNTTNRFVLHFGAYGWTRLLAYADNLEDALDECVDWIAEHAPGLLADDTVAEEYERLIAEGMDEDEAREEAEVDTTIAGNAGHYLNSWEWGILAENPTRAELLALAGVTK
jgi:hypothetical protein